MLMKRIGIMITKMIHRRYEMGGNGIVPAFSSSVLRDIRKISSNSKSPAVMDMTFMIAFAG